MPPLFDAHQHFQFDPLTPHRARIVEDLQAIGLRKAVVNATNEEEWPVVSALAHEHAWIVPSHGVHPWDSGDRKPGWLEKLRATLIADPSAGVGEIGLDRWIIDGVRPDDPRIAGMRVAPLTEQIEVFFAQLVLAAELNRAASIHCVQAFGAVLETLERAPRARRGFLLHGYGGPAEMIPAFVHLGAYFSFNIELEGARHHTRRDSFRHIPADRLLVETDAPTKPPTPDCNRFPLPPGPDGKEINHPANLVLAYEALAKLRGTKLETLATQVEENFTRLFL